MGLPHGRTVRTAIQIAVTILGMGSCDREINASRPPEPLYVTELLEAQTGVETDSFPLFRIRDMVLADDGIAILDSGNNRLLKLSSNLRILSSMGQKGSGPGEFELTNHLVYFEDQYVVSDIRNGRLSYFERDGTPARVEPLPGLADYTGDFVIASDGAIFVTSLSDEYYLAAQEANGQWHGFGRRLFWPDRAIGSVDRTSMPKMDDVLIAEGDTIYVLDNLHGVVIKMHPSVGTISAFLLPMWLIEPIQERDRAASAALGGAAYSALFKDFRLSSDGRFFLLFNVGDTIGATFGQRDLGVTPIIAPQSEERGPLRSAFSAMLQGDTLFVGSGDGIRSYRLADTVISF